MANPTTGLFETLVAAVNEASACLKFENTLLGCVNTTLESNYSTLGNTLNVIVPTVDTDDVTDIGAGDIAISETAHTSVSVLFDKKYSASFVIRDYDQAKTPLDLRTMFVDSYLQSVVRKANLGLWGEITAAKFNTHSTITGGAATFDRDDIKEAWVNLGNVGAPIGDTANLFMIMGLTPYGNMVNDDDFSKHDIVAQAATESARQQAVILRQYGATMLYDQQATTVTGTHYGLFFHRNAIALRTGLEHPQADGSIREFTVYPKPNIPIRVQMYNSVDKQGTVVHLKLCCGHKVIRPEYGNLLISQPA